MERVFFLMREGLKIYFGKVNLLYAQIYVFVPFTIKKTSKEQKSSY